MSANRERDILEEIKRKVTGKGIPTPNPNPQPLPKPDNPTEGIKPIPLGGNKE